MENHLLTLFDLIQTILGFFLESATLLILILAFIFVALLLIRIRISRSKTRTAAETAKLNPADSQAKSIPPHKSGESLPPAPNDLSQPGTYTGPYLEYGSERTGVKLLPFNQWPHREQVIGRASITAGTTLQIDQTFARWETVSQRHVRIYFDQAIGHSIIEDLDSDNGLYVQGRRTARNLLKDGLTITLGGVNFIYREKQPDNQIIMRNQERG